MPRASKINGFVGKFESSFLSCSKDAEIIFRKLLVDSRPYSDQLKRLLVINTPDCLRDQTNQEYINKINSLSFRDMIQKGYLTQIPKMANGENEEIKSRILLTFDNFVPNRTNPHFRDCIVEFDIICHTDCWDIGNYEIRPFAIMGYIDGILNNSKLTGIGTLNFLSAKELVLNEEFSGYCMFYQAVHGSDDLIPGGE